MLYIFRFLHQTTTATPKPRPGAQLYIFRFLHQTTTIFFKVSATASLYIFRFLHQTTTYTLKTFLQVSCISFVSYIKPQPRTCGRSRWQSCISFVSYIKPQPKKYLKCCRCVVYLSFPTSNHNDMRCGVAQTVLYIFRFLHQTTTTSLAVNIVISCISFVSYIKPQHSDGVGGLRRCCISFVSYIKPQLQAIWY